MTLMTITIRIGGLIATVIALNRVETATIDEKLKIGNLMIAEDLTTTMSARSRIAGDHSKTSDDRTKTNASAFPKKANEESKARSAKLFRIRRMISR